MKNLTRYAFIFSFIFSSCSLMAQHQQEDDVWQEKVSISEVPPVMDIKPISPTNWWKFIKDKPNSDVQENLGSKDIKVYPNPSNGHFNVEIPSGAENLSICTATGATIFEMDLEGWEKVVPVDLSEYSAGTYFVFMSLEEIQAFFRICVIK